MRLRRLSPSTSAGNESHDVSNIPLGGGVVPSTPPARYLERMLFTYSSVILKTGNWLGQEPGEPSRPSYLSQRCSSIYVPLKILS